VNVFRDENLIDFDEIFPDPKLFVFSPPSIFPTENSNSSFLFAEIEKFRQKSPKFSLYCKSKWEIPECYEEFPENFHYKNSPRVGPILVLEHLGYLFYQSSKKSPKNRPPAFGMHGYSNDYPEMWPFFQAYGPAFRKNFHFFKPQPENVDLYNLMSYLLDLKPAPNNGSWERISHILQDGGKNFSGAQKIQVANFFFNIFILFKIAIG